MTSNTSKILIEVIKQVFSSKIRYKSNFDTIKLINNRILKAHVYKKYKV